MEQIHKTHSVKTLKSRQSAWFLVKYGLKNAFRPINCDLYAYAANNPLRYIDPDGRELIIKITRTNFKFVDAVEKDLQQISPAARVDRKNGN